MPERVGEITETGIIKDVLRQLRRHRANAISQEPIWTHDTFTAPATYQLTSIPYGINALADNKSVLSEGTDYTVDYTTGLITFAVAPTAGHVIFVSYVTNGDLIALSGTVDTGLVIADTFNRADSTTAINPASDGGTWTTDGSPWGIYSNRSYAVSPGTGDTTIIWVTGLTAARRNTGTVACDVTAINYRQSSGNPSFGLLFSANPTSGYGYAIYNTAGDPTKVFLGSCQSGSIVGGPASPATVTSWAGGTATFEVQHDGVGHITVLMNGSTILTWDDSASTTHLASCGGWVGPMGHPYNDPTSAFSFDTWDNFTAAAM